MGNTGTASAIPENLYAYSRQCVQAGQELQAWINGALLSALEAYQSDPVVQSDDFGALTSAVSAAVQHDLPQQIAAAGCTDQSVGLIGRAFETAGAQAALAHNACLPPDAASRPVTTTDTSVDQAAGSALAAQITTDPAAVFQELQANQKDPAFCKGFAEALSPQLLRDLFRLLNGDVADGKILRPSGWGSYGAGYLIRMTPDFPIAKLDSYLASYRNVLFGALESAFQVMDYKGISHVMHEVAKAVTVLPASGDPREVPGSLQALLPDLSQLTIAAIVHSITPIHRNMDPGEWAAGMGGRAENLIEPILKAVQAADLKYNQTNDLAKSILLAIPGLPGLAPEKKALAAIENAISVALSNYSGMMPDRNVNLDIAKLWRMVQGVAVRCTLIRYLITAGAVSKGDGKHSTSEVVRSADNETVAQIASDDSNYIITGSDSQGFPIHLADVLGDFKSVKQDAFLKTMEDGS